MNDSVSSRLSIFSKSFGDDRLRDSFTWKIEDAVTPSEEQPLYITTYDLEVGEHERVDHHLHAVKDCLLEKQTVLRDLQNDCGYTLWVRYYFENAGAINLKASLQAVFSQLQVEVIFHLGPEELPD